jgi:GNAT superfamily N-acetyltransferase
MESYDFILVDDEEGFRKARKLFVEYAGSLNIDLCFQHFNEELESIAVQYSKPDGGLIAIVCKNTGEFIGCAGVRKYEDAIAELKRMYIKSPFRGKGLGRELLHRSIKLAKELHYNSIRLDTLDTMTAAIALYTRHGFREIPAYRFNPCSDARYFELTL